MNRLPTSCPICDGAIVVQSFHCRDCDATVSGHFAPALGSEFEEAQLPVLRRFARLSVEQLQLLESFVRCEGKLNRLQEEIGVSYPTLRSRLDDVIRDLGFTPRAEEASQRLDRQQILQDLQEGKISAAEATTLLQSL